jgi:hypothetical protein
MKKTIRTIEINWEGTTRIALERHEDDADKNLASLRDGTGPPEEDSDLWIEARAGFGLTEKNHAE